MLLVLPCVMAALFVMQGASANHYDYTPTRFDDPTPNGCQPADCSLREAIIAAEDTMGANTIHAPAGTYTLSLTAAPTTLDGRTTAESNSP